MKRSIIILLLIILSFGIVFSQHFTKVVPVGGGNGPSQMNFWVQTATINGIDLQVNDEVAVFDGIYCVGVGIVSSPGGILSIIVQEDIDGAAPWDGYTLGHTATLKIWDASRGIEITDISGAGGITFIGNESAWLNLTATVACTPPAAPTVGTITQPTCSESTGSVVLSGLPSGNWTINPGDIDGSGSSTTIPDLTSGTYNFTFTDEEGCTSETSDDVIINTQPVTPAQPGTISGDASLCQGTTETYSVTPVSGATTYNWTLPSGWSGSSTSASINAMAGANGGTISVSAANTCGTSAIRLLSVSVNTVPAQPGTIIGATSICQGTTETYSVTPVSGATSYTWTLPSGWSGSSTSASINATPGANGGTISVTANNSCGSGTARTLSVSVTALPAQPGTISGDATLCQGTAETYSITPVSGASSYTWTLPSGWSGSSTSSSIDATAGASGGTISVTATNSCATSAARTLSVTVNTAPAQPGTIDGAGSVCQGSTETYSITPVSGASSYSWTLPSGWSGSSTSASINATAGASGGTISVTATNSCGTSAARTLSVSVTTVPAQPGTIGGATSICQGSAETYSVTPVSGATSYTWTLPSGWSGSSTSASINATPGATGGTISVTANNSCGSGTARTLSVSVTPLPAQPGTISGDATLCQGTAETYSITPVSGASSYTWTLPSGWSGSSTSSSIDATAGASGGTISVTATNSCGTSAARTLSVTVNTAPAQPGTISGDASLCQGTTETYSVTPVSGATTYNWILPSGWSGSSTSASINATAGASGGMISVTATNSCGTSAARTLSVSVTTVPAQPGTIGGATSICQGSAETYSVTPVSGASSYTWTLPSGWSGSSTSASINATPGATGGTISVTANNSCGSGTARTLSVSVTALPAQPGTINGDATLCQGTAETYSITPVSGASSYTWTLPSGWSGSSTSASIDATAGASGGTISVTATNSCGTSAARTLNVTVNTAPAQPGTIGGEGSVCQGSTETYSITPVSGASSYTWTLPSGWSGSSTSASINATAGASGGTISVTATNSCGTSAARTLSVSVTTVPAQPGTLSGTTSLCQGSAETYSVTPVSGATSYTWTLPSGWIGNSTSASINVIASANGGTISITANNTCGSGTVRTLNVSISETPSAPVIGTISQPTCAVATGSVILSGLPSSGTWTITRSPGGALYSSTGTSYTVTGLAAGTYTFSVSNASGCSSGSSADAVIESNPATPSAPTVGTITQPTCDESTGSVVLNGLPSTGSWTLESNPGETISGTGTSISLSEITSGTYNFAVTNESGCISEASADVVINAQPEIPATPAVGFITQPTCAIATGDVVLEGLPSTGDWTITIAPGGTTKTGTGTTTTVSDLSEGTFNFTVTNESGCVSAISADVIIDAQPETPATPTITQSANILYSDAIAGNQWYDENGIINGATGQEYIPASAGNYYVIVTNDENCSSEPSNIINYVPTGIVKSELSKIIKLYPNPTDGKVRLSLAGENSHKISVEVLDILGQTLEIDKVELPDNQIEINLKGLSGGTYLVKITFSGNTLIEKVILR